MSRQLLAAGLLDELHLLVHPIAARKGARLFDKGEPPIPLTHIMILRRLYGVEVIVCSSAEPGQQAR